MRAVPRARQAARSRAALRIDDDVTRAEVAAILERRGVDTDGDDADAPAAVAVAPRNVETEWAAELADRCLEAARARAPLVVLASRERGTDPVETAASLGFLRSHGAIVCRDPSVWIETVVLTARLGLPLGPRAAIVAAPGSLIDAQAAALSRERTLAGSRLRSALNDSSGEGHDAVLVDVVALEDDTPERVGGALVVPVTARAEAAPSERPTLVELRHALAAVSLAGELALRSDAGLGPGPDEPPESIEPEHERFDRQLGQLKNRAGDHETKVLLSAYGIEVSRQAVATTASAATRIAKRAGFPVDIKPWGPDVPTEAGGCPVERDVATAADVRRAFTAVGAALELPAGAPVIVRAAPPRGRELSARVVDLPDVGWTVVAEVPGQPEPIAAPAPLSAQDAEFLARPLVATREGDRRLDTGSLADLLVRASYLVWQHEDDIAELQLARIILPDSGDPALVIDACAVLRGGPLR